VFILHLFVTVNPVFSMKILLPTEIHNWSLLKQRHGLTTPSYSTKMLRRDHASSEAKATQKYQYNVWLLLTSLHRRGD